MCDREEVSPSSDFVSFRSSRQGDVVGFGNSRLQWESVDPEVCF